jgi:hypothetical protein
MLVAPSLFQARWQAVSGFGPVIIAYSFEWSARL